MTYDLHPNVTAANELVGLAAAEVERELILATNGNRTHAASILDISIRALRYKLRNYADDGIEVPAGPDSH
jgi:DNA-binding protein Fis